MARLGSFLLRASILAAVGWIWFNYVNGYPMSPVSAQAGIMVLIGIALYALTGVPPSQNKAAAFQTFCKSSGSFAIFAAIRCASSRLNRLRRNVRSATHDGRQLIKGPVLNVEDS
jgi:hypothetical protein